MTQPEKNLSKEELLHTMPENTDYKKFGSSTFVFYNEKKYKRTVRQANSIIWILLLIASILIGAMDAVCTVFMAPQTKLPHVLFLLICLIIGAVFSKYWGKIQKSILRHTGKSYVYAGLLAELLYQVIFYVHIKEGKCAFSLPGRKLEEYREKSPEELFKNLPYRMDSLLSDQLIIDATDEDMLKIFLPHEVYKQINTK